MILITIAFLIGTATFAKIFHFSIQQDQWLDQLFNWQNRLEAVGHKQGFGNEFLYKALGACSYCFSHLIAFLSFWIFVCVANLGLDMWFLVDGLAMQIVVNIIVYLFYISTSTCLNNLAINFL